ncbi:MAG: hypothetical protein LBI39_02570, partial [Puniceicoccales bacterium]|nr:hypothetical protein [Puniceicoccales bacterium]
MSAVRVEPNLFDRLNAPSPCVGNLAWRRNVATYRDSRTIAILGNEINFQLSAIDIIQTAVLTILTLGLVWLAIAIYAHVRMADENSALSLLSLALNAPPSAPDRDTVKPDDESAGSGHSSIVAKNAGEAAKSEAVAGEDATGETSRSECEKVIQKSTPAAPSAPPPAIAPNAKSPIRTVPPPAPATVPPPAAAAVPPKAVAAAVPRKAPPAVAPSVATVSPTTATVAKKPPPKALPPAKAAPKPAKPRSRPPAEYAPGPVVPVVAIEKSQTGATVTRKSKSVAPPRNGNSGFESIYECANYFFGAQTEFTVGEARYPNAATMLMAAITSTAFPNVGLPKDLLIEGLLNPAELMVRAGDTARGGRFTEAFKEKIIGPLGSALKLPVDIALERITENPTLWNRFMQRLRDAQIMAMSSKNYRISISETLAATAGNGGKESAIAAIM